MLIAVGILLVVLLTFATGYFVAQEFAYVSVDRMRLRQLADEGDEAAERALQVTGRLSFTLSGAQFGITVTALLVGYAGEPLIGAALADLLGFTGLPYAARLTLSVLLVLVFSTVLQMVIGELAPKNLAIARPVPLALALSRSTQAYLAVAGPVIHLFDSASNRLLRMVGIEPVEELAAGATTEDLEHLIDESRRGGSLDEELSGLLERGLAFRGLTAEQAMTPRVAVVTVPAYAPVSRVVELLGTTVHSRFPVVADDVDDVVGVIGLAEVLGVPRATQSTTRVGDVCADPVLMPGTLGLPAALETLRAARRQLAVVVDEFGGLAGVLSLEDIAEEVVGEILDEGDVDTGVVTRQKGGVATVAGRLRLDEIEATTGLRLPPGTDYTTVGGLVMDRLGRVALAGDVVVVTEEHDASGADQLDDPDREGPPHTVVTIHVDQVERHVPTVVTLTRSDPDPES